MTLEYFEFTRPSLPASLPAHLPPRVRLVSAALDALARGLRRRRRRDATLASGAAKELNEMCVWHMICMSEERKDAPELVSETVGIGYGIFLGIFFTLEQGSSLVKCSEPLSVCSSSETSM